MTARHTPGPWHVGKDISAEGSLVYIQIFNEHGRGAIACAGVYGHKANGKPGGEKYTDRFGTERYRPYFSEEEARANAALIAAAPEMLDLLIALIEHGRGDADANGWNSLIKRAESLIAKAESGN